MDLGKKVENYPFICEILLSFLGEIDPMTLDVNASAQSFFDSKVLNIDFESIYFGKGSFHFSESSGTSDAGISFEQKVSFQFPSNDKRATMIDKLQKIKYITLVLTDGRRMLIGRNDYKQNTPIRPKFESNLQFTDITIVRSSMFSVGFIL